MTVEKRALRIELAARRAVLHAAQPLAGLLLCAQLPRIEGQPGVVSAYWPFRSEIDPRPLMARFARAGWRLALPVTPTKVDRPLSFHLWTPGAETSAHPFGMTEPHPDAEAARPDVMLVPLLAFDRRGHRLGYGAGHYDRTLRALRATGPVRTVGLAFAGQEADPLPTHAGDEALDAILTERGLIEFAKHRR